MARKRRDGVVKQLSNLSIDEVSLVDRGANQHATIAISKALTADDYFGKADAYGPKGLTGKPSKNLNQSGKGSGEITGDNDGGNTDDNDDFTTVGSGKKANSFGKALDDLGVEDLFNVEKSQAHEAAAARGETGFNHNPLTGHPSAVMGALGAAAGSVLGTPGAAVGAGVGAAMGDHVARNPQWRKAHGVDQGSVVHNHFYGKNESFGKALDQMDVDSLFDVSKKKSSTVPGAGGSSFGRGGEGSAMDTFSGNDLAGVEDDPNGEDGNIGPGGKLPSSKIKGQDMPPRKGSTKGGGKEINSSGYDGVGKSADFWTRMIEESVSKHFPGAQDPSQSPFPGAAGPGQPPTMQTPGVQPMGMGQPTPPPMGGQPGMQPQSGMPQQLPPDVIQYIQQLEQALEQAQGGDSTDDGGDDDNNSASGNSGNSDSKNNPFGKSGDFGMNQSDLFLQELAKSLDEDDNREMIGKAYEAVSKAEARAAQAEQIAKAERDLRLEREFIAKAAELNTAIPSKELGPVLKRLAESVNTSDFQTIVKALKASDAQASIFNEFGKRGGGDNISIMDEVNARAQEFVGKSLTPEQAVAQVFDIDPRAYDQYVADQRSAQRS